MQSRPDKPTEAPDVNSLATDLVRQIKAGQELDPATKAELLGLLTGPLAEPVAPDPELQTIIDGVGEASLKTKVETALNAFIASGYGRPSHVFGEHGIDISDEATAAIVVAKIIEGAPTDDLTLLKRKVAFFHDFDQEVGGKFNAAAKWRRSPGLLPMWKALLNRLLIEDPFGKSYAFIWEHVVHQADVRVVHGREISINTVEDDDLSEYTTKVLDYLKGRLGEF